MENRSTVLWLLGLLLVIGLLYTQIQSCNKKEMNDRSQRLIQGVSEAIDSSKMRAEKAWKEWYSKLDEEAKTFQSKWKDLGNAINVRLDTFNLRLPEKGVEIKLLDWINNKTAPLNETTWFNFDRILFVSGSSKINAVSNEQLDNIAYIMKGIPTVEFKIGGYTDNTGNADENLRLSQERADAVRNALIERGIDGSRLSAEGYGSKHPVGDNNTEQGRELNRRVAIRVTKR